LDETDFTQVLEHDYKFEQIQKAMQELDNSSKDIIYWKYIEEKSNAEISSILSISEDNIRQKISRAIKHLKSLLETDL
jgi:RNA polymerase sigma factor (sigma-70 family)